MRLLLAHFSGLFKCLLQGGSPFKSSHFPTQFGIISKLHQDMLELMIQVTYEDIR